MKSHPTIKIITALAAVLTFPAALDGQTIGIAHDQSQNSIRVNVDTIPTQQFWLTQSDDLANWTNQTFINHSTNVDLGPPTSGSHFFRLDPLYGPITWSALSNMPVARDQFTGGVIDRKLYVFGGNPNPGGNLKRLDIYDLDTGQWTRGPDYDFGVEELSSAVVGGKLYVFGCTGDLGPVRLNICYDPVTTNWSETAPKPTQIQAATVVAWGNEILVLGGWLPGGGVTTNVEAYHAISNTWRIVTQLPEPIWAFAAGIHEDVLYLVGGGNVDLFTMDNKVRRFDLSQGVWLPDLNGLLDRPLRTVYSSACPIVNGELIIGGGQTTRHGGFAITSGSDFVRSGVVTVYDIQSNTISTNTPLPEPFNNHLFLLVDYRVFALGGQTADSDERTSRMVAGGFEETISQPDGATNRSQPIRVETN